jgi:hypothetical protein
VFGRREIKREERRRIKPKNAERTHVL